MANEAVQDELAWDYTADECSPLLRRAVSPHGRRDRPCTLTYNQVQYLLHSLGEAAQILRNELHRGTPEDGRLTETVSPEGGVFHTVYRLYQRGRRYIPFIPVLIVAIQILTMLIETVIDACLANHTNEPHNPYTAAVFVTFSFLLILILYVDLVKKILRQKATLVILLASFLSSLVLFASLYTVFYRFDGSGWVIPLKRSPGELYVVTFLRMVHTSISVFTFCNDASGIVVVTWYPLLALSIQMLLAYFHLVVIIATVFNSLLRHPTVVTPTNHTTEFPQFQRDADAESITFGTHLAPVVNSRPVTINRADRTSLHSNTNEAGAALLLSNSI